jgi:pseudouridine synthase
VQVRLQKILSGAGVSSRRTAESLMRDGRVSVNGRVVLDLGTKADHETDDVRVDGRRVKSREKPRYLLLNKPRGYVTTLSDPERRPTVLSLLGGVREYVYPVGRLDFDSEGLLILTNDGDLAAKLTHPRHEVARVYEARVRGIPDERALARLSRGVVIDERRTAPATVRLVREVYEGRHDQAILEVVIREGRNRQVRKMFESVGHPVFALKRTRIGPLTDPRLPTGGWRDLMPKEVAALQRVARSLEAARAPIPVTVDPTVPRAKTHPRAARDDRRPRGAAPERNEHRRPASDAAGRPPGRPRGVERDREVRGSRPPAAGRDGGAGRDRGTSGGDRGVGREREAGRDRTANRDSRTGAGRKPTGERRPTGERGSSGERGTGRERSAGVKGGTGRERSVSGDRRPQTKQGRRAPAVGKPAKKLKVR